MGTVVGAAAQSAGCSSWVRKWTVAVVVSAFAVGCGAGGAEDETANIAPAAAPATAPDCLRGVADGTHSGNWVECFNNLEGEAARIAALIEARCLAEVELGLRTFDECNMALDAEAERQGCHLAGISIELAGSLVTLELDRREGREVGARAARVLRAAAGRIESLSSGRTVIPAAWGC